MSLLPEVPDVTTQQPNNPTTQQPKQPDQWTNDDNSSFYTSIGVDGIRLRVEQCGMTTCPDMIALQGLLKQQFGEVGPARIIDIGAGYGRVTKWCVEHYPNAQITLVEYSAAMAEALRATFGENKNIILIEDSVLRVSLPTQQHLVLWPWAGCTEFTKTEMQQVITAVSLSLVPSGLLAIEVPRTVGKEVQVDSEGNMTFLFDNAHWHGQIPSSAAVKEMASLAGLMGMTELYYETETGLKRTIYVLQKPDNSL